jgi:prepilin-type N-terminal cleavage/methylation domain-containing protein
MAYQFRGLQPRRSPAGFTLIETMTVLLMVGIMAAIGVPSLLGFLAQAKINSAFSRLDGLLKLTQREAVKKSKTCTFSLPNNDTKDSVISSTCSVTGSETLDDVIIKYNRVTSKKVSFSYRGHTSSTRTIVVYSNDTNYKRCLVISNGIGMMRKGKYTGSLTNIVAEDCKTSI